MEENLIETNGRLYIKDDQKFLEALSGSPDPEVYAKFEVYGKKYLENAASDIPMKDKISIINMALFKGFSSFNKDSGAKFLTYFTSKLRGEVSDYRNKRTSMLNKVHNIINSEKDSYVYVPTDSGNMLDKVTLDSPESLLFAEDMYRRKIQAFRMSYSLIPLYSQYILSLITEQRESLAAIAIQEGLTTDKVKFIRNSALSLILSGVLRSNHLDEDEKNSIREEHDISVNYKG